MYIIPSSLETKLRMRLTTKGVLRKILACLAFFYCISCLRFFLPKSIRSTDILHLAQLVVEWQNFPVETQDDAMFGNESIPVQVRSANIEKYLRSWSTEIDFASKSVQDAFQQPMTLLDRQTMLVTLDTFIQACELTNLTYFIIGGTMLGAYRHHGFIPWDDDIDVVVNASDWRKIRHVLSHVPGYDLYAPSDNQWKFFMEDLPKLPKRDLQFKWPNIDIFFFTEDTTYIWGLTTNIKDKLFSKKSDFFPLQYRPFENRNIAVPCNMEDIILKEFDTETCVSRGYCHKTSTPLELIKTQPCKELQHAYPFVFRSQVPDGGVVELLKVGNRVVRNVTLPRFCGSV